MKSSGLLNISFYGGGYDDGYDGGYDDGDYGGNDLEGDSFGYHNESSFSSARALNPGASCEKKLYWNDELSGDLIEMSFYENAACGEELWGWNHQSLVADLKSLKRRIYWGTKERRKDKERLLLEQEIENLSRIS